MAFQPTRAQVEYIAKQGRVIFTLQSFTLEALHTAVAESSLAAVARRIGVPPEVLKRYLAKKCSRADVLIVQAAWGTRPALPSAEVGSSVASKKKPEAKPAPKSGPVPSKKKSGPYTAYKNGGPLDEESKTTSPPKPTNGVG